MSLRVLEGGLQTTLQAAPRAGFRHKGVPASGPADMLSHALANRLVGNKSDAAALEITLSGASFRATANVWVALTGGAAELKVNTLAQAPHATLRLRAGDICTILPLTRGARAYLAVAGGLAGQIWLGSVSTYLPAGLGGFEGRALKTGDELMLQAAPYQAASPPLLETPVTLRPHIGTSWMLRTCAGPDAGRLTPQAQEALFQRPFTVTNRANRMGAELHGQTLSLALQDHLPSAAVFPGTLQCPPSGKPFLLMADAQTTGGYPRIAQVVRADRHMLGQLRQGNRVQFRRVNPEKAGSLLTEKTTLLRSWLGDTFELS